MSAIYVLKRTVGAWSAGTRVRIVEGDYLDGGMLTVEVQAGTHPQMQVHADAITRRRPQRVKEES